MYLLKDDTVFAIYRLSAVFVRNFNNSIFSEFIFFNITKFNVSF